MDILGYTRSAQPWPDVSHVTAPLNPTTIDLQTNALNWTKEVDNSNQSANSLTVYYKLENERRV